MHVDLPIGRSRRRVDVLVVWKDVSEPDDLRREEASMAELVGLLEGADLERHPQGAFEKRDEIA